MEVVGSKKKVVCRQSASLIACLRVFPVLPLRLHLYQRILFPLFPQQKRKMFFYTTADCPPLRRSLCLSMAALKPPKPVHVAPTYALNSVLGFNLESLWRSTRFSG